MILPEGVCNRPIASDYSRKVRTILAPRASGALHVIEQQTADHLAAAGNLPSVGRPPECRRKRKECSGKRGRETCDVDCSTGRPSVRRGCPTLVTCNAQCA